MSLSLVEKLLAGPSAQRVVPHDIARGYRDMAGHASAVTLTRAVRCAACSGRGCDRCESVGWKIEDVTAAVTFPHGASHGTRVAVEGAGDTLDGPVRPVIVELCEPGERAAELRAADRDFVEKLRLAWSMERVRHARRRRRRWVALAVGGAALAASPFAHHFSKARVGEPCSETSDCRSAACLRLITFTQDEEERLDGRMCTASCATDLDCPSSMTCTVPFVPQQLHGERRVGSEWQPVVTQFGSRAYVRDAPPGRACVPRGY